MKKLFLIFGLLIGLAQAQGSFQAFSVQSPTGAAIAGASVALCSTLPTQITPCGGVNLQATYTDITESTACTLNPTVLGPLYGTGCTNPGLTDGQGNANIFASTSATPYYYQTYASTIPVTQIRPILFPASGVSGFTPTGDLGGTAVDTEVIGLEGHSLPPLTSSGCLDWNSSAWILTACSGGGGGVNPGTATYFALYLSGGTTVGSSANLSETVSNQQTSQLNYVGGLGITLSAVNGTIQANTTNYNWSQTTSATITGGVPFTYTFAACPLGIYGVDVLSYIQINSAAEYVQLAGGGTCVPGSSGTIKFTTVGSYTNPTLKSASNGIQEALNAAMYVSGVIKGNISVKFAPTNPPATTYYTIGAPVELGPGIGDIDGSGASIDCETWACFYASTATSELVLHGFRVGTATALLTGAITGTACASNVATITSTLNPPVGSYVDQQFTDNRFYWGIYKVATSSSTSYTYSLASNGSTISCTSIASAVTPGGVAVEKAFLEDNGNFVTVRDVHEDVAAYTGNNSLPSLIVVDNDQEFVMDAVTVSLGNNSANCTSNYCGHVLYGQGGNSNNPVGSVINNNWALNCQMNGVMWLAGQGLRIGGSEQVIEGFPQYGIMGGKWRGSSGQTIVDGVYQEIGSCTNPDMIAVGFSGNAAYSAAGVNEYQSSLQIGFQASTFEPSLIGQEPVFSAGGSTLYEYLVVVNDGSNQSVALRAGQAAPSSSASYQIGWPRYPSQTGSTVTYDVLKVTWSSTNFTAPYGTGNYAVATGVAQCSTYICTMNDSSSTVLTSYTIPIIPTLTCPALPKWPGAVVLSACAVMYSDSGIPSSDIAGIVVTQNLLPNVYAARQDFLAPGVYVSSLANSTQAPIGSGSSFGATVMPNLVTSATTMALNSKGRINFGGDLGTGRLAGTHYITINDSNFAKTIANSAERPVADANDAWIGTDQAAGTLNTQVQLASGAPVAISQYIANVGDNVSYLERLTAAAKIFNVPVNFNSNVFINGTGYGLAFPFAAAAQSTDTFVGTGGLGGNWTVPVGTMAKANGAAYATALGGDGTALAVYTGASFTGAQIASVKLNFKSSGTNGMGVVVFGSSSANTAYECYALDTGTITTYLQKVNAGSRTTLNTGPSVSNGDILSLTDDGNGHLVCNDNGVPIITATDTTLTSGYPGFVIVDLASSAAYVSNFSGGNWSYSISAPLNVNGGGNVVTADSFTSLTFGSTTTWAVNSLPSANATVTLTGNTTLNVTGLVTGGQYVIRLQQDSTGGRTVTLGTGCTWKVSGGGGGAIVLTPTANAIDILSFMYDATTTACYANIAKNFN